MIKREKFYKFSMVGLEKAVRDRKKEISDRRFDIVFWVIMIGLCGYGIVKYDTMIKIMSCNLVSRTVKWIMR